MSEPDFLVCLVCDTPTYIFEYKDDKVVSGICSTCGNEDKSEFITDKEWEEEDE